MAVIGSCQGAGGLLANINTCTIGGVGAAIAVEQPASGFVPQPLAIAYAIVNGGTQGTVSWTLGVDDDGANRHHFALYRVVDFVSATPVNTYSAGPADAPSVPINVPAFGLAIAAYISPNTGAITFTGLTKRSDASAGSGHRGGSAMDVFASEQSGLTVSADNSTSTAQRLLIATWA